MEFLVLFAISELNDTINSLLPAVSANCTSTGSALLQIVVVCCQWKIAKLSYPCSILMAECLLLCEEIADGFFTPSRDFPSLRFLLSTEEGIQPILFAMSHDHSNIGDIPSFMKSAASWQSLLQGLH